MRAKATKPPSTTIGRMVTEEDVYEALEEVIDPELGLDFVSLGLVYDVEIEGPDVYVTFTLTTPGCPIGPQVSEQMKEFVGELEGVEQGPPEDGLRPALVPGDDVRGRQVRARVLRPESPYPGLVSAVAGASRLGRRCTRRAPNAT